MKKAALLLVACMIVLTTACGTEESLVEGTSVVTASPSTSEGPSLENKTSEPEEDVEAGDQPHISIEVSGGSVAIDPEDSYGFLSAVTFDQKEVVLEYIEAGVQIDFLDDNGFGALYNALYNGNMELAKLLLEHGAAINIQNEQKYTPLLIFAEYDSSEIVEFLLENGADPNIGGGENDDYYPIIAASLLNYPKIVKLLLDHDAYPNLEYVYDGETVNATQIAERYGFTEIEELIQKSL